MREVMIGGSTRRLNACPYCLFVYERAFGSEHQVHDDVNALLNIRTGVLMVVPLAPAMRLLYAYEMSAIPRPPMVSYDTWLESLPNEAIDQMTGSEADGWITAVVNESIDAFFPRLSKGADVEPTEPEAAEPTD